MLIYLQMIESDEDKNKFEQVYNLYKNLMFTIAKSVLDNNEDAEDAVHNAFISIINQLWKIEHVNSPQTKSFVSIVAKARAIDIYREKQMHISIELDAGHIDINTQESTCSTLSEAIKRLPERTQDILILKFDNGYSTKEIAEILGMKRSAVQKCITRAKEQLRILMSSNES